VRLALIFPPGWIPVGPDTVSSPGGELRVTAGPLGLLPDDQASWIERALATELPAGGRLEGHGHEADTTDLGWPLRLVGADVVDAAGQVIERRVAACYAFLEHGAIALVRAASAAALATVGDALRDTLRAGAPDWSGPVVALAPLFDVVPLPPELKVDGWRVRVVYPAPGDTDHHVIHEYQAYDAEGRRARLTLTLETSELGREVGAPFVLAVDDARGYRVLEVYRERPDAAALAARVEQTVRESVG